MSPYDLLIAKLNAFIRKYYANQLLRGVLVLFSCLLAFILLVSVGEYFLFLPVWIKLPIAIFFLAGGLLALVFWIVLPLSKMLRMGPVISHEQAAQIIGKHFGEVDDQLLNILQLRQLSGNDISSAALIEASIGQKINRITPIPILQAVDMRANRKYLRFLLPLLLVFLIVFLVAPYVFSEAGQRLLRPATAFRKPAPFQFRVQNTSFRVLRNEDYTLQVRMAGKELPAAVFIRMGEDKVPMEAKGNHLYEYTFRNCIRDADFELYAAGFSSDSYHLEVLQKPLMSGVEVRFQYPSYTGRKDEVKNIIGDIVVPVGTDVSWNLHTQFADDVAVFAGTGKIPVSFSADIARAHFRFLQDTAFSFQLNNRQTGVKQDFVYKVQVIPDQHPSLQMDVYSDSTSGTQVVINGVAGDDYGVSRVLFHYQILDEKDRVVQSKSTLLKSAALRVQPFQHYFDMASLSLPLGAQIEYYVEAWDNDAVHGSKSVRSEVRRFSTLNAKQIDSAIQQNTQQINSGISNSTRQNEMLQEQMKQMQMNLLQSGQSDWQQKKNMQDMLELQLGMKQNLEKIKKRFEEQMKQTEQSNLSEALQEKQEDIKKQLDNLLDKELKEQMQKLQELMQQLNKQNAVQDMQQLQEQNKLFSMDMERLQELMKQLEMQIKMESIAQKAEQLAQKQSALREATDRRTESKEALMKEQQQIRKETDNLLNKEMKELEKMNDQQQQKQNISQEQQQGEQASDEMQNSEQQLQQNQNNQSSQSQSKAVQNLQQMARSLQQKASGMDMQQLDIDIKAVRQILSNLMRLSFDQEKLMQSVRVTAANNPVFLSNIEKQNALHVNSLVIRDSLFTLSKRMAKISAGINKETSQLEKNMRSAMSALEQRKSPEAATKQQYVMTHANNLALMLNEILSNLLQQQKQGQQQSNGQGQCSKPGGKTPKPGAGKQLSDIISKQQGLSQQMGKGSQGKDKQGEESKKGEDAKNGKKGEGGQVNGGGDGNARELMQLAQQQAAIRKQLAELNQLLNSQGGNNIAKDLKEIQEQMDRNEIDLVNKRLNDNFYRRQQEILSRLLETETALREQDQDDKRSSRNPEELARPVPPELQPYLRQNAPYLQQYQTVPPTLKPFYKELNNNYFKNIQK